LTSGTVDGTPDRWGRDPLQGGQARNRKSKTHDVFMGVGKLSVNQSYGHRQSEKKVRSFKTMDTAIMVIKEGPIPHEATLTQQGLIRKDSVRGRYRGDWEGSSPPAMRGNGKGETRTGWKKKKIASPVKSLRIRGSAGEGGGGRRGGGVDWRGRSFDRDWRNENQAGTKSGPGSGARSIDKKISRKVVGHNSTR